MKRVIITICTALVLTLFVNARSAFSQDDPESGTSVDGTSVDANWNPTGPTIDEDAASADKVLEIPQAACTKDDPTAPCDTSTASADDPNDQTINAPQPGAPPSVYDDDTASSGTPDSDWGDADDYQNQQVYAVPYAVYGYPYGVNGVNVARTNNVPSPVPASAFAPMSSPITQAALPPLHQGPWMNPPTMSAFARPAGSPMVGMRSFGPSFGFHH
jgi:hypothetical protein